MGMDRVSEFGSGHFEGLPQDYFGNHVGGVEADDLAADHPIILLRRDDFDEAFRLINRDRLPVRAEWDLTDLDIEPTGFGVCLAQADRRDFRLAVDAAGYCEQVETGFAHSRHDFDRGDSFRRRLMR